MSLLRLLYCSIRTVLSSVIYILRCKDQHNHKRTQRICEDVNNVLVFQLLGELLLDRHNFTVMTRYISNQENLKLMMNMLRDKSRNIQFEAFHVFKVITLITITSINYAFHAPFPEFFFQNTCETSFGAQILFINNTASIHFCTLLFLCWAAAFSPDFSLI